MIYIETMRNRHINFINRFFAAPDGPSGHDNPRRGHHRHHKGGHHGGRRLFDYGELRFLLLAMIAERPRHGYEIIKAIEERFGGSYSPSPGVIYPTLSWLDDMGYATIDAEQPGRKCYRITPEGEAFLSANKTAVESSLARASTDRGRPDHLPAPVVRAMENLKLAIRLRVRQRPIDQETAEAIAAALDEATRIVERGS